MPLSFGVIMPTLFAVWLPDNRRSATLEVEGCDPNAGLAHEWQWLSAAVQWPALARRALPVWPSGASVSIADAD